MRRFLNMSLIAASLLSASAAPPVEVHLPVVGNATYYHRKYIGRLMANGRPYRAEDFTMATWEFPLGSIVRVQYRSRSGTIREVIVEVTDRGPDPSTKHKFDLSWAAFRRLENHKVGVIEVSVTRLR